MVSEVGIGTHVNRYNAAAVGFDPAASYAESRTYSLKDFARAGKDEVLFADFYGSLSPILKKIIGNSTIIGPEKFEEIRNAGLPLKKSEIETSPLSLVSNDYVNLSDYIFYAWQKAGGPGTWWSHTGTLTKDMVRNKSDSWLRAD